MSYADIAAKGPKQSAEERAPAPPQVEHTEEPSIHVMPASNNVQAQAKSTSDKTAQKSSEAASTAKDRAHEAKEVLNEKTNQFVKEAEKDLSKAKSQAKKGANKAEKEIKREYNEVYENRDNPVIVANGIAIVATVIGLAYGGYQKHQKGELDWQVAGATAAIVGLLGVGDYYLSQYLFKNKFPKK